MASLEEIQERDAREGSPTEAARVVDTAGDLDFHILRGGLIGALEKIAALEARVAELEAINDRRESYEAEQNERS